MRIKNLKKSLLLILTNAEKIFYHKSLCYFCINEHMYLIEDGNFKKLLLEKAKDKNEIIVKSSLF